jgi:acyl-CoA thioesterase-1
MLLAAQLPSGCSPEAPPPVRSEGPQADPAQAQSDEPIVLAFGDSLYAGYGLEPREGFTFELERALEAAGHEVRVHNAGVSGDTSEAGRQRLVFALEGLPKRPALALVGLGGNDMLRGLDPARTRANLDAILAEFDRRGIPVILTGMRAAPNMGSDFVAEFDAIYADLARQHGAALDPFFLEGVATSPQLMQADRIHPNAAGIDRIVARVAPIVAQELAKQK